MVRTSAFQAEDRGSIPRRSTKRDWYSGNTSPFQGEATGSIPVSRSMS